MDREYKIGQIWEYHTRDHEKKSRITIVEMSTHGHFGLILNISVDELKIVYPFNDEGFIKGISHIPCSKDSMDKSVIRLVEVTNTLPDFEESYNEWKEQFDIGKAGVFTGSVQKIIKKMEEGFLSR